MRVLVTGNEETKKDLGNDVIFFPTIRTARKELGRQSISALKQLLRYDYILFTSANAVRFFVEELKEREIALPAQRNFPKVVAIGPETARTCRKEGFRVAAMPKDFTAKGVVKMFKTQDIEGKRILFPQSAIGSTEIAKGVRAAGAHVKTIPLYTTLPVSPRTPAEKARFAKVFKNEFSCVVFMSPSSVQSFRTALTDFSKGASSSILKEKALAIPAFCIGPVTAKAAKQAGFKKVLTSNTFTARGLASTIKKYLT